MRKDAVRSALQLGTQASTAFPPPLIAFLLSHTLTSDLDRCLVLALKIGPRDQ